MQTILSVAFWLLLWQVISMQTRYGVFLASPIDVITALYKQVLTARFWLAVLNSLWHILCGYLLAMAVGSLLAFFSHKSLVFDTLLTPIMRLIRTVPVVSFVILALILLPSGMLTVLIAFLMALPIFYQSVLLEIKRRDIGLKEMALVYGVSRMRRFRFLDIPQIFPGFEKTAVMALSFAWKSGTAAEVIGSGANSIGGMLQQAKIYLDTPELFAWTLTVVLVSILTERLLKYLLRGAYMWFSRIREKPARECEKSDVPSAEIPEVSSDNHCCAVELRFVSKNFGEKSVLDKVSLSAKEGEILALMAPSGAGKTTLLRIIAGTETPDSGEIKAPEKGSIRLMFQEDRLLEYLNPVENVLFTSPCVTAAEIKDALTKIGLGDSLSQKTGEFSGGMKRRVALVRALLSDSELLLLDEPLTGLDEDSRLLAVSLIKNLRRGRTVILTTHREDEAALLAARIAHL
ncbi:MAG: ATP-binding cassette domain-containing protein [Lachnospiraceae bacterium]|nr:ATP-binding cassette domain-containing protein [Lachnospiraceae bacterium]